MPDPSADPLLAALERLHGRLDHLEARLDRIDERLAPLAATVAPVGRLVEEAPAAVAMVTDAADAFVARVGPDELEARLQALARTVERLTHPDTLRVVDALLARADRLEGALTLVEQAPAALAMVTDSLDQLAERVATTGTPLHERLEVVLAAAERLSSPAALGVLKVLTDRLDEVRGLLESGVLDPEAVRVVSLAGKALVEGRTCECGPVGPVGALLALREPPIQRALGFLVAFARQFGVALDAATTVPATRS